MANSSIETRYNSNFSDDHKPRTLEDVTQLNVQRIVQLEEEAKANRSQTDRIADGIAHFCGSTFVWVHVVWFVRMGHCQYLTRYQTFQPFPFHLSHFGCFTGSDFSLYLYPYQPEPGNAARRTAQPFRLASQFVERTRKYQNTQMLERIAEEVGAETEDDPSFQGLCQATHPEKLVQQIEEASAKRSADSQGFSNSTPT